MKKPSVRTGIIATTLACATLIGVSATPAFADTSSPESTGHTLVQIQANGAAKTAQRVTSLTTGIATITANTHLSSGDKSTILGTLNNDLASMKSLQTKIAADTTKAEASADYKTIFTTYRVYAVALPQSRYAAATAGLDSVAIPRLTDVHARLTALLAGKDAAKSTATLQADLTDMNSQIASAKTSLSGLSTAVLAVTPAQYTANHAILTSLKQKLTSARTALKQARTDAKAVVTALRSGKH
jgi:hypothetical protein